MTDIPIQSKYFIPKYLQEYDLYKHLEQVLDLILNDQLYTFTTVEELNDTLKLYFGSNLTEDQKENVLIYYKIFVEPYLGTLESIERIFNILNVNANIVVWYENRVPLPPYKFNLEFAQTENILNYKLIKSLIDLVKNERSHLASVKNTGEPDIFVWDYSYWDLDCWDSPTGVIIDGILYNLKRYFFKEYFIEIDGSYNKQLNKQSSIEKLFMSNEFTNNDLQTNFNEHYFEDPKFSRFNLTPYGLSVNFDTVIGCEIDDSLLTSQVSEYKISIANQHISNYSNDLISHINAYSKVIKNNVNKIKYIVNKTLNNFSYTVDFPSRSSIITSTKYKNYPIFNFNKTAIASQDLSNLITDNFSIFGVMSIDELQISLKSIFKTDAFNVEISQTTLKISTQSNFVAYNLSLPNNFTYFYLDNNSIKIGSSFSQLHNLNLKFEKSLSIGNQFNNLKLTNLLIYSKSLSLSELNSLIITYCE